MNQKELKILTKYFIAIFIIVFFAVNWNDLSWIFNYKALSILLSDYLKKLNPIETGFAESKDDFSYSFEKSFLEIPKLALKAPIVFPASSNMKELTDGLKRGVVYFPDSVLPGKAGQTIILGHSAPLGWPKIQYQWVFSEIEKLKKGDEIILSLDDKELKYFVESKIFLEKGEELPKLLTNSNNVLILISCWPPGKNIKRIAVVAYLTKK